MKPLFKLIPWVLFVFTIWLTLVCASLLSWDESGNLIAHSFSIWGDWSAHFSFISGMKERGLSWLWGENPVFAGVPFQYPFLSHLITAFFSFITRMSVVTSTYSLSLILIALLPYSLYRFFKALGLSPLASFYSVMMFLLMGGVQYWDSSLNSHEPLTNQFEQGSVFTQFVLFEFFPQRAFLFGLLTLTSLVTYGLQNKTWSNKKIALMMTGFSLLAWIHVHSWIAMGALLFFSWVIEKRNILKFGLSVAAISGVLLALLLLRPFDPQYKFVWNLWYPGWAQNPDSHLRGAEEMNLIWFWIYNTGIFLPLAGFGIYISRKNLTLRTLAITGSVLFLVAELFNLQAYFYDNLKLFTYAFFFLTPLAGLGLESLSQIKIIPAKVGLGVALVLLCFQCLSGFTDMESMRNHLQNTTFFTSEEIALADKFKEFRRSPDSLVLIAPRHNHWLPCLTGNPIFMGYPGWLWTWGIKYGEREAQMNEILLGGPHAEALIQSSHAEYLVLSRNDQAKNQPVNTSFFDSHYKKIFESPLWGIYSLIR